MATNWDSQSSSSTTAQVSNDLGAPADLSDEFNDRVDLSDSSTASDTFGAQSDTSLGSTNSPTVESISASGWRTRVTEGARAASTHVRAHPVAYALAGGAIALLTAALLTSRYRRDPRNAADYWD